MQIARFAHHRLDAFHVSRDALVAGDALVKQLPRGYGTLGDQLRRALLGAYLQLTEAAARDGHDRRQRFRCARAEANEAAAAVEAGRVRLRARRRLAARGRVDPDVPYLRAMRGDHPATASTNARTCGGTNSRSG